MKDLSPETGKKKPIWKANLEWYELKNTLSLKSMNSKVDNWASPGIPESEKAILHKDWKTTLSFIAGLIVICSISVPAAIFGLNIAFGVYAAPKNDAAFAINISLGAAIILVALLTVAGLVRIYLSRWKREKRN